MRKWGIELHCVDEMQNSDLSPHSRSPRAASHSTSSASGPHLYNGCELILNDLGWLRCLIRQQRPKAPDGWEGRNHNIRLRGRGTGVRGAAELEASAAGKAIASFGPLLALEARPSEAADLRDDGRTPILTKLPDSRQETQRVPNKTLEIPSAHQTHSHAPILSPNQIAKLDGRHVFNPIRCWVFWAWFPRGPTSDFSAEARP
jgi:hypothetical protein